MISLVYIGLPRFQHLTRNNHKQLVEALRQAGIRVQIVNCTQPRLDRSNSGFTASGHIQVWDFYESLRYARMPVIMKVRTDLWFTEGAIAAVVKECKEILNDNYDVAYFGLGMLHGDQLYKHSYKKLGVGKRNVLDWLVVAHRAEITPRSEILDALAYHPKIRSSGSGNFTWKLLCIPGRTRAYQIACQLYLIRDKVKPLTSFSVGTSMMKKFQRDEELDTWWQSRDPKKQSIAVVYIGDPRFPEVGLPNHEPLIQRLHTLAPTQVYHFTKDRPERRACPWDQGGANQVWDFLESAARTPETIVIKLRTDLWFTPSSIDAVISEVERIVQGELDHAFFGSNWKDYVGHTHTREDISLKPWVMDFVVAMRKSGIKNPATVYEFIENSTPNKRACGTKLFGACIETGYAVNVFCQIYLVRRHYDQVDPWQVGLDYIQSYKKQWKMPDALPWYLSTK